MRATRYFIAGMLIVSLCACDKPAETSGARAPATSATTASDTDMPISNSTVARTVRDIKQDAHTTLAATRAAGTQFGKGLQQAGHDLQEAAHKAKTAADNAANNAKSGSSSGS